MRGELAAGSLALAMSAIACGDGGGPGAFVGSWSCSIPSSQSTVMLVVVENADGSITVTGSGGGLQCALKYSVQANTATVESGQTCMTVAVTSGTATLSGSTLSGTLSGSQTVGGVPLTASEAYSCSKQ